MRIKTVSGRNLLTISSSNPMEITIKNLYKAVKNPIRSFRIFKAFLRGLFYIIYYRIIKGNSVRIKFPFWAFYKVKIVGPGSVFIDKNCRVMKNLYQGLTIVTFSKNAKVKIGKKCSLGGLTIYCHHKIEIKDYTMTANSLVQDNLLCHIKMVKSLIKEKVLRPKPVIIGKNVWLGMLSCVLSGSIIGDYSVISIGSVCYDLKVKEYHLAIGNLVKRLLPIEHLLLLQRKNERLDCEN